MEYPSKYAPSLSGEDGGEFPASSLAGLYLAGLPLGHEMGTLREWPPPSLTCPMHAALGRVLPTSDGMESDSLDIMEGTGWFECSTLDLR